jgi:hypothetical protein
MKSLRSTGLSLFLGTLAVLQPFQASAQVSTVPTITTQPVSLSVATGASATFSVVAAGATPLTYQWFKADTAITTATSATFTLDAVTTADAGTYAVKVTNLLGTVTSAAATLTVTPAATDAAPAITTQPVSLNVGLGAAAAFTVVATGSPAPQFQWHKNGRAIEGATSATLTLSATTLADAAVYTVQVANVAGRVTSDPATLTVNAVAGTIVSAPVSANAKAGADVTLSVATTGADLTYQWKLNGRPLKGATSASLVLTNVGTLSDGSYSVIVSNGAGPAAASAAAVAVTTDARLTNIATRGHVGADDEVLISGFVTRGTGAKKILLRAVGPTLGTEFNVPDALAHPTLTLYHGSTVVDTNTTWGGSAELSAVFTQVGAFPLGATSADAALVENLDRGAYSAIVTAPAGSSGIALVEAYDADPGSPPAEIVNISTRALVGAEAKDTLIAGFAITGTTSDTVLIRGVGPSLGTLFGLRRALGNSHVAVFDSTGAQLAANTIWGRGGRGDDNDAEDEDRENDLDAASDRCGAWHLPRGSNDSALLLTLAPGVYTAHVTGVSGKSGIGLVEIYEVH